MEASKSYSEPASHTLHSIFNSSPFGIAVIGDEKVEIFNQQFCDILSLSGNEIIGKPIKTFFGNQEDYLKIIHLEPFETNIRFSACQRTLFVNPQSMFNHDGTEKILLFISDITNYKQTARQITDLAPELHSIFNLSPSLLLLLDEYTNVLDINDTALSLVSKAREQSIGLRPGNVLNCIRSYDSPRGCGNGPQCKNCIVRKTVLETLLTGKNNYRVESPFPLKSSGGVTVLTVLVSTICLKRNEGPAVLVVIDDITDRKQLETELKISREELTHKNSELQALNLKLIDSYNRIKQINTQLLTAKERAEESDRLKSSFLANISHQIRTPLNGIVGFLELLEQNSLTKEQHSLYTGIVNECAGQFIHTMTDICEIARLESGQMDLNYDIIDVNELLSGMHHYFKDCAITKGLDIKVVCKIDKSVSTIITDADKLRQILTKLLDNAICYTSKGKIEFGCTLVKDHVEFFVRDTGVGFRKEDSNSIYEHFRKPELSENTNFGGIGLGLFIARSYVKLLGGKIWIDPKVQKGTTFHFSIPVSNGSHNIKTFPAMKHQQGYPDWSDKTILVVEDEEVNTQYLRELLSQTNVNLLFASDAETAISICRQNPGTDLVLMDIKLPDTDGYKATRTIKQLYPDLPIIAQTAYAMSEDRLKALESGCCDYIAKPIRANDLLTMVQHWLMQRTAQ